MTWNNSKPKSHTSPLFFSPFSPFEMHVPKCLHFSGFRRASYEGPISCKFHVDAEPQQKLYRAEAEAQAEADAYYR